MNQLHLILMMFPVFSQTQKNIESSNWKSHFLTIGEGKSLLVMNGGSGMNNDAVKAMAEMLASKGQGFDIPYMFYNGSKKKINLQS